MRSMAFDGPPWVEVAAAGVVATEVRTEGRQVTLTRLEKQRIRSLRREEGVKYMKKVCRVVCNAVHLCSVVRQCSASMQ